MKELNEPVYTFDAVTLEPRETWSNLLLFANNAFPRLSTRSCHLSKVDLPASVLQETDKLIMKNLIDVIVPSTVNQAEALVSAQDFATGLDLHTESSSSRILAFDRGFSQAGKVTAISEYGSNLLAQEDKQVARPLSREFYGLLWVTRFPFLDILFRSKNIHHFLSKNRTRGSNLIQKTNITVPNKCTANVFSV